MDAFNTYAKCICIMLLESWSLGEIVDLEGQGLTSVPWDQISINVTELNLAKNTLREVYVPDLPYLEVLDISGNQLHELPNIDYVTSTLQNLKLGGTKLLNITWLPEMDLRVLVLGWNRMTTCPDFTNVSTTLRFLVMRGNKIPALQLAQEFPVLRVLDMGLNKLDAFPNLENASSSLVKLRLDGNRISDIPITVHLPVLELLDLSSNLLTKWPNLSRVNASLKYLNLSNNNIQSLGSVTVCTSLELLNLSNNYFVAFPDLVNASAHLNWLGLSENDIVSIDPPLFLSQLTALKELHLDGNVLKTLVDTRSYPPVITYVNVRGNPLSELPNYCRLDTSMMNGNALVLKVGNNKFECHHHVPIWLKIASIQGSVRWFDAPPECASPSHLASKTWDNITLAEMLDRDAGQLGEVFASAFRKLTDLSQFYCYPAVTDILPGLSKVRCAAACRKRTGCMFFAVDGGKCVITQLKDGLVGTKEGFHSFTQWYIFAF